jgi:type II secretory pathway component HofQ
MSGENGNGNESNRPAISITISFDPVTLSTHVNAQVPSVDFGLMLVHAGKLALEAKIRESERRAVILPGAARMPIIPGRV